LHLIADTLAIFFNIAETSAILHDVDETLKILRYNTYEGFLVVTVWVRKLSRIFLFKNGKDGQNVFLSGCLKTGTLLVGTGKIAEWVLQYSSNH
jgi:hypothetical protein